MVLIMTDYSVEGADTAGKNSVIQFTKKKTLGQLSGTENEQVKVIKTRRQYHLYFLEVGDVCSMNVSNGLKTEPCVNQSPDYTL